MHWTVSLTSNQLEYADKPDDVGIEDMTFILKETEVIHNEIEAFLENQSVVLSQANYYLSECVDVYSLIIQV